MRQVLTWAAILLPLTIFSQDMYRNFSRENNRWRVTPGIRIGEPLGFDFLLYKGANCKSRRPWKLDLSVGLDGGLYGDKDKTLADLQWNSGGIMTSLFYYHELPIKPVKFINLGIGPFIGNRKFEQLPNGEIAYGLGVALNTYLFHRNIEMKRRTFLNITLMFDLRYSYEFNQSWGLFRPSFTVLVDYFK